jgi:hypothetical protein
VVLLQDEFVGEALDARGKGDVPAQLVGHGNWHTIGDASGAR